MSDLLFEIGATYHRVEDIHDEYGGTRYRGIAPSGDYPYVFLFTGDAGAEHGYRDEFQDDGTFLYTGEGREGDMTMERGNKQIREHAANNEELHVFEQREDAWEVVYLGEYEYENHHRLELPDRNGNMREAIRFELVPAGGREIDVGARRLDDLSLDKLYERAEASATGEDRPTSESSSRTTYSRSEVVKEYALQEADGVCQGCGDEAPFLDEDGEPFLEVHHLHRRSDGGADHPDNVVALCPNCHRRVHYGQDGEEFNQRLIKETQ